MIEVSINEVEGVRFLGDIQILEPDDMVGGLGVHRISDKVSSDSEFIRAIKALGLRKAGRDMPYKSDLYAQFPIPLLPIKVIQFALKIYWAILRWLYDNARVFKQIPPCQPFSWSYFTPYVWYRKITNKEVL